MKEKTKQGDKDERKDQTKTETKKKIDEKRRKINKSKKIKYNDGEETKKLQRIRYVR